MRKPQHTPELPAHEQAEVDAKRERRDQQPYATELDNRELETAHKEKRPIADKPAAKR